MLPRRTVVVAIGRQWQSTDTNERTTKAIKPCRVYREKKCGRVTERRKGEGEQLRAALSKSAAGVIRELFGHSINNERWECRWPSTLAAVSTGWKKNERSAVVSRSRIETHNSTVGYRNCGRARLIIRY